jgi:hypothetical protein
MYADPAYPGDEYDLLRDVQAEHAVELRVRLANAALKRLRSAAGAFREPHRWRFPRALPADDVLDRRELELAHDVLAAEWRQQHRTVQTMFRFMERQQRCELWAGWRVHFGVTVDSLVEDGEICLPVLRALQHRGTARGNRAERELAALVVRYLYRDRPLPPSEWGWPLGLAADVVRRSSHVCQGHPLAPLFALTAPG